MDCRRGIALGLETSSWLQASGFTSIFHPATSPSVFLVTRLEICAEDIVGFPPVALAFSAIDATTFSHNWPPHWSPASLLQQGSIEDHHLPSDKLPPLAMMVTPFPLLSMAEEGLQHPSDSHGGFV